MKKIIFIATLLVGSLAFADHHEEKMEGKFSGHKAKVLAKIDKRIEAMNSHKKCVSAAADKAALKACRAKMKEVRGEWKEERKSRKKARKSK